MQRGYISIFFRLLILIPGIMGLISCSGSAEKFKDIEVTLSKNEAANLAIDKIDDFTIEIENRGMDSIVFLLVGVSFKDPSGNTVHKLDLTPIWADETMYGLDTSGKKSGEADKYKPLAPGTKLIYGIDLSTLCYLNSEARYVLEKNWKSLTILTKIKRVKYLRS